LEFVEGRRADWRVRYIVCRGFWKVKRWYPFIFLLSWTLLLPCGRASLDWVQKSRTKTPKKVEFKGKGKAERMKLQCRMSCKIRK